MRSPTSVLQVARVARLRLSVEMRSHTHVPFALIIITILKFLERI